MNYLKKTSYLSLLFLAACFPKEEAIDPLPRLGKSVTLDAGEYKNTVAFYSLDKAEVVSEASPMEWDFYVDEDVIRINYFRSMRVAEFDDTWDKLEDTVGLDFRYLTTDNKSTEGLSQWELAENQIYVVDYGLDNEFNPIGLTSVRFERTANGIKLWYNAIGSDYELVEEINEASFYYNLRDMKSLDLPTEKEYDLAFGKYTDLVTIDNITLEYPVYGAIQGNTRCYELYKDFSEVTSHSSDILVGYKDIIGWDWKNFNRSASGSGVYEILPFLTYVISSNEGFKYKLRFVNFYNDQGQSGHPTFEWELL